VIILHCARFTVLPGYGKSRHLGDHFPGLESHGKQQKAWQTMLMSCCFYNCTDQFCKNIDIISLVFTVLYTLDPGSSACNINGMYLKSGVKMLRLPSLLFQLS